MDPKTLGEQFVQRYYSEFESNRAQCVRNFFTEASTYSFEGETLTGMQAIGNKLAGLNIPPGTRRTVTTKDIQPSALGQNAIVIFVTGDFAGTLYQEAFQLVPNQSMPSGFGFYVHNAIFRVANANPFNCPQEAQQVSKAFIEHYFKLYDGDRQTLVSLYKDTEASLLTHEGNALKGRQGIMEKLCALPKVQHDGNSFTVDVHCVNAQDKTAVLFMLLSGQLSIDGQNPLKFAQVFQIIKESNSYFIGNQLFRLNYGG